MLNNKKFLAKLMAKLRSIDENVPLPNELEPTLWELMKHVLFKNKALELVKKGQVPQDAYYLVAGFILVYYLDGDGNKRITRIYAENSIVALDAFMSQQPSDYYIVACPEAVIISISHEDMLCIYRTMPQVQALAVKTAAAYEKEEMLRDEMLALSGEDCVLAFYTAFGGLLPPRKSPVKDACIASYLRMSPSSLKRYRKALKEKGLLKF